VERKLEKNVTRVVPSLFAAWARWKTALASGARTEAPRRNAFWRRVPGDRFRFRRAYLREVRREIGNLFWRIRMLREKELHRLGIELSAPCPICQEQCRYACTYLSARSRSMQRMRSILPAVTLTDLYVMSQLIAPGLFGEDPHMADESSYGIACVGDGETDTNRIPRCWFYAS
jgi:hypothetical protein